ncbi:tRNA(fMet)-specific endonuclease VapC [archaeon HR04]|nr:tRNA(fMet)-specific endonuclease VapC [archaeon HR04]
MLYIDSNIFIYPVIYDEQLIQESKRAKELLYKIATGKVEAYTSIITWDEVVWVIRRVHGVERAIEQGRMLLRFPNLKMLSINKATIIKAQELMERYRLKPRDALHIAVALENRLNRIASYDKDLDGVDGIERIEP